VTYQSPYKPGSKEDFDQLYRDSYSRIVATLTAMTSDSDIAQDLAQETFVSAFKNWRYWRPSAPAEAWLHRIAINICISHRRKEHIRSAVEIVRRLGRPLGEPATAPLRHDLMSALRKLPPKQAAVVVLRHYHGYSNREIAKVIGVPERTVASRLAAAVKRLQVELGGPGDSGEPWEVAPEEGSDA
jgi:RNA polymerase sigma-70 factor (ECF subfamily)